MLGHPTSMVVTSVSGKVEILCATRIPGRARWLAAYLRPFYAETELKLWVAVFALFVDNLFSAHATVLHDGIATTSP